LLGGGADSVVAEVETFIALVFECSKFAIEFSELRLLVSSVHDFVVLDLQALAKQI
jgi:hypothetical protein